MDITVAVAVPLYLTCILDDSSTIELYQPDDDPHSVSILVGDEQLKLDFYGPEALKRLVAVATAGLRALGSAPADVC